MLTLKEMYRITTFVPPNFVENILTSVCKITPLRYGDYDSVAWWSSIGTEQFRPLYGTNPSFGEIDEISQFPSIRLEFVIPHDRKLLEQVITFGLIPIHPWEEPVIHIDEIETTRIQRDEDV